MIEIVLRRPADTSAFVSVKGHSGYARKGSDIVCSAVSALVQTMTLGIKEQFKARIDGHLEQGDTELSFSVDSKYINCFFKVYSIFRSGFEAIASSHPEHVRLVIEE